MQTSIKILQLAHQLKKDGTTPILIRVTQDRKSRYIKVGYAVAASQFKEGMGNWVVKHPDSHLINAAIESKRAGLMDHIVRADIDGEDVDISALAGRKRTSNKTVFGVIENLLSTYEKQQQVASFTRLTTNLGFLKDCWGKDISLSELNKYWVEKFSNYRFAKGNGKSTVKKNLMDLGVAMNSSDFEGKNYFSDYAKTIHPRPAEIEKFTIAEIKLLEKAKLHGLTDLARDMFLFSYYCQGMRFENVATFSVSFIQGGFIVYRMNKGEKMRQIEVHPKLAALIEKYKNNKTLYLFPIVKKKHTAWTKKDIIGTANTEINTYLNRAAILCGIERHVHFHMARHSFAGISLIKKVSLEVLKDALGHSNFATTQKYAKQLSDDVINKAVRKLWD